MALSPMMQHYVAMKEEYPDCILFYRLGDFYEMFFEDAVEASRVLELTLTGRDCGLAERAPMCGVPFHAADTYIGRLVEQGYKVAICEQVEDPRQAKGMVKREVIRIVTPGTAMDAADTEEGANRYLMCIVATDDRFGASVADISTGQCLVTEFTDETRLTDEIRRRQPAEIICNRALEATSIPLDDLRAQYGISLFPLADAQFNEEKADRILLEHFRAATAEELGLGDFTCGKTAAGALLRYLYDTQMTDMGQITAITPFFTDRFMELDASTRQNLELTRTIRGKGKTGSLLWVLDDTRTSMGARMLRSMIEQPLIEIDEIAERLDAVEALKDRPMIREEIREYLQPIYDLERISSKIVYQSANPRDLIAFRDSLAMLPAIRGLLPELPGEALRQILEEMDPLGDLHDLIAASICDDPPVAMRDGGIIRDGYSGEVDRYRLARTEGRDWLAELEAEEKEKTGIKNLRIKYNKVFGYYLEVTNSYRDLVPEHYERRQTLANAERYTTPRLKELEEIILGAEDKLSNLEYTIFCTVRDTVGSEILRIQKTARAVARLDAFASLAHAAERGRYVRPAINREGRIRIRDGRHPVVEKMLPDDRFVANDTDLDEKDRRMAIITGPNMAGKSTYMRQTALIVLMAQIGSFVPASEADIGIVDRIFTRVGASDDLASGQSTFMVEMSEVANILRHATRDSLIILDEIGRGTSTFDGLSIAWAVVEFIADKKKIGAKTLFATHYHELTELEGKIDGVQNYCIAVKERGDDIVFLRKIVRGGADRSYGIQVARLAGVPDIVITRAKELSGKLSGADITSTVKNIADNKDAASPGEEFEQLSIPGAGEREGIAAEIAAMDLARISPLEALNLLYDLQEKARGQEK